MLIYPHIKYRNVRIESCLGADVFIVNIHDSGVWPANWDEIDDIGNVFLPGVLCF